MLASGPGLWSLTRSWPGPGPWQYIFVSTRFFVVAGVSCRHIFAHGVFTEHRHWQGYTRHFHNKCVSGLWKEFQFQVLRIIQIKNLSVHSRIYSLSITMIIVFNLRLTMKPKEPSDCHFIDLNEVFLSLECYRELENYTNQDQQIRLSFNGLKWCFYAASYDWEFQTMRRLLIYVGPHSLSVPTLRSNFIWRLTWVQLSHSE